MHEKLTDPLDQAAELIEDNINRQLQNIKSKNPLQETGYCLNCSEALEQGFFCDKDCRDDYDYILKRNEVNGKNL